MILVLMFEFHIDSVRGLKSWSLLNVNLRGTEPDVESKTFYPDMPAIRILDESMCRGAQKTQVKFRLLPPRETGSVVEDSIGKYTSCLNKIPDGSTECDVCFQDHCDYNISLPCKSVLGVSRWDSVLLIDVTIDQMAIVNCSVMCKDIGYFGWD
ncbi:hypothetical protein Btru_054173 [Bulinus truncatus]|nr:hypothetical protein Btru_054173 [Bulinus truncatus]